MPADAAAALAALEVLRSAEGTALVQRLEGYAGRFRRPGMPLSPIVPIVVGAERAALEASAALIERGPVRAGHSPADRAPRSFPAPGHLSAAHTGDEVDLLADLLERRHLWP